MIILSDKAAFERIYTKYFPRLVLFAQSLAGTVESAEDIVQDVFLKLHRLDNTFDSEARLSSFLYTSVRNRAIDHLRSRQRMAGIDASIEERYGEADALNDKLDGDLLYLLAQSVKDLPQQSRNVIRLLFENDLSYGDVAAALDISPHTVKHMRKFALELLRKKFRNRRLMSVVLLGARLLPGM
jgi:RNA polymerase sigma-70 factor (ECF subfamily)